MEIAPNERPSLASLLEQCPHIFEYYSSQFLLRTSNIDEHLALALSHGSWWTLAKECQAQIHSVDVDTVEKKRLIALYKQDYATARQQRFAHDPEIAANIWYATQGQPVITAIGIAHLRDFGLPSHFDKRNTSIVPVFSKLSILKRHCQYQDISPAFDVAKPHYIYLGEENVCLKPVERGGRALTALGLL